MNLGGDMGLHVRPIPDQTLVDFEMASGYTCSRYERSTLVSQFNNICVFCDLQNVKDKSKPVVPSKDSKELDKLCKRFLIPTKKYTILPVNVQLQKISILPPQKGLEFSGGWGVL